MTLAELDDTLPNGIHDAYLVGLSIAFDQGLASLKVRLLTSKLGEKVRREAAEIRLSGLVAFVVEGPERLHNLSRPLAINSFETSAQHYPAFAGIAPEVQALFHSLYVEDPWNSFIHIAAADAEVVWSEQSS